MKPKYVAIGGIIIIALLAAPLMLSGNRTEGTRLTWDLYDRIQISHTYNQVKNIIGRDGIPMEMTIEEAMDLDDVDGRLLGIHGRQGFQVYGWKNTKGSARGGDARIIVMFANEKVVAKKQIGLE